MYEEWTKSLVRSPLFRNMTEEGLAAMMNCLQPRLHVYGNREIIAVYGQSFTGVGIIAAGKVALTRDTYSGGRIVLDVLKSPDIFGEVVAFSDDPVWPATVVAQEDCTIFFLPPDKITGNCANICPAHKSLINNILRIVSNKALAMNRKIEHLSAPRIRGKISSYLLDEYGKSGADRLRLPMQRQELADYLGIPRPSLSREMGFMRDEGIIEFRGREVYLRDILALEQGLN